MSLYQKNISLAEFGQHIVIELAVPALVQGYSDLVNKLAANQELVQLAKECGIDAVLSGNSGDISALRKQNKELVTVAEKVAESLMAAAVKEHFPEHAIVGEEHGFQPGGNIRWVFDPVDGTSAMIRTAITQAFGLPAQHPLPAFGITAAVVDDDEAVLGIVAELQPINGVLNVANIWIGEKGEPTVLNGKTVAGKTDGNTLASSTIACTVPDVMFHTREKWGGYQALAEATAGCITDQNCIGFMKLMNEDNSIDIVYEADLAYHDAAAIIPILNGAGITTSNGNGDALRFPENAITHEFSILAAQPDLHKMALECIKKGVSPERNSFAGGNNINKGYAQKFSG